MIVELKGIIFPKSNKVANRRSEPSELSSGHGSGRTAVELWWSFSLSRSSQMCTETHLSFSEALVRLNTAVESRSTSAEFIELKESSLGGSQQSVRGEHYI